MGLVCHVAAACAAVPAWLHIMPLIIGIALLVGEQEKRSSKIRQAS